jgi:hypothetical protein
VTRALAVAFLLLLAAPAAVAAAPPLVVTSSVDRASASVGDRIVVRLHAAFDPAAVDAATVRAELRPGALSPLGPPRLARSAGSLEVTQLVACLEAACAPTGGASRRVELPPARAVARLRAGDRSAEAEGAPLVVAVVPRVSAAAVAARRAPYVRQTAVPPPGYRSAPGPLSAVLLACSLLLLALAVRVVAPRRRSSASASGAHAARLGRALRLVRESARRPGDDRRRALDLLAETLAERAGPRVDEATRLAWSPREPEAADATALADAVESSVGGRP